MAGLGYRRRSDKRAGAALTRSYGAVWFARQCVQGQLLGAQLQASAGFIASTNLCWTQAQIVQRGSCNAAQFYVQQALNHQLASEAFIARPVLWHICGRVLELVLGSISRFIGGMPWLGLYYRHSGTIKSTWPKRKGRHAFFGLPPVVPDEVPPRYNGNVSRHRPVAVMSCVHIAPAGRAVRDVCAGLSLVAAGGS
jgi:hypothetical protein